MVAPLQAVAWETTRACPLACIHCRAEAQPDPDPAQLSTQEGKELLRDIASFAKPVVILTGGEPLLRPDIFELADYGASMGLYMVISPDDGRLLTQETVSRLKAAGIQRVSFSLHYPNAEENDSFARTPGAFAAALEGLANLRVGQMPFQINTTVTKRNMPYLPQLLELAKDVGAAGWDLFFLVPTGRARMMAEDEMTPEEYEQVLNWLYDMQRQAPFEIKQTCAPHFRRVVHQRQREEAGRGGGREAAPSKRPPGRGCLCGDGFSFISHTGEVCGCGYLPISAGNVRQKLFSEIYRHSSLFEALRDYTKLGGKCGRCEYRVLCRGCRARAYTASSDFLAEEPYCSYQPRLKAALRV